MDERKNVFKPHITLSLLMLLSIVFVPMFDPFGGFFSSYDEYPFWENIASIFEEGFEAFEYFPVIFTMSALIPCIIMLLGAINKSRGTILFSSISGIVLMSFFLLLFIDQNELDDVFDLEWSTIGVGFWIPLALFVVSLFKVPSSQVVNEENNFEQRMPMHVRYNGGQHEYLSNGEIYEVANIEDGYYRIIDEGGEGYLCPPDDFEIIE